MFTRHPKNCTVIFTLTFYAVFNRLQCTNEENKTNQAIIETRW